MSIQKKGKRKIKDNQQKLEQYKTGRFSVCLILSIIVGVVPIILYFKQVTFSDPGYLYMDGKSSHLDIFSYYKMVFILLLTTAGLALFLYFREKEIFEKNKKIYYFPLGIFVLLTLLSALFSEYRKVAFFGFLDRYEGGFVLISYAVLMFLAMNIIKEEKMIKLLFGFLMGSAFIIAIIGTLQYFGIDYFKSSLFMSIVTPISIKDRIGEIKSLFPPHTIASTLLNSNYVGSYMAMLLPINIILLIHSKKIIPKGLLLIPLFLIVLNWIGCQSRAGIIGGILSILVIIVMFRRKIFEHKGIMAIIIILLCGAVFIVNFAAKGVLFEKIGSMISIEEKDAAGGNNPLDATLQGINDIKMDNEKASIITELGTLNISLPSGQLLIQDETNNDIGMIPKDNIITFNDDRYKRFMLNANPDASLIEVYYNDYKLINIFLTDRGLMSNSNIWMTYRGDKNIETLGFKGMESLGSNRGYIWSRTIPLLKDTIILGHGPDTFPMYFPQYDYIGKLKMYQNGGIFVDKPHNLYLQTAVNTGLLSLLALIAVFGIYLVTSLRIYWKEKFSTFLPVAGLACFSAFCGYAAAGLFNDSVVSVAPVFWVLLGLGCSINSLLNKNNLKRDSKQ